jgi:hypothetical protein
LAFLFGGNRGKAMKRIFLVSIAILFFVSTASSDEYLGNYSSNPYDPNSTSNPFGAGMRDDQGQYPLPIWVDHVGSKGTVWRQFELAHNTLEIPAKEDARWIEIRN